MDVCIVQHTDVYSTCALEACISGVLNKGTWLANSGGVMDTHVVCCMHACKALRNTCSTVLSVAMQQLLTILSVAMQQLMIVDVLVRTRQHA